MNRDASENSLGMLLIGFTLATCLFGANTLQTYVYFQKYNDGFLLKAVVIIAFVSDTLNTIFTCWGIYMELVPIPLIPLQGNVPMVLESTVADVAIFFVQCFFAQSVYQVSRHNKWLAGLILILAMLAFASGMALTAVSITSLYLANEALLILKEVFVALALGLVTLTDIIITVSLVWYIFDGKSSAKQASRNLFDKLILYCVQRGILTTVSHAIVLVLWFDIQTEWTWSLFQFSLGKVYTFTFLTLLNRRESLKGFQDRCHDNSDIRFEVSTTMCCDDGTDEATGSAVQSVV